jgi:hypothetical protein
MINSFLIFNSIDRQTVRREMRKNHARTIQIPHAKSTFDSQVLALQNIGARSQPFFTHEKLTQNNSQACKARR